MDTLTPGRLSDFTNFLGPYILPLETTILVKTEQVPDPGTGLISMSAGNSGLPITGVSLGFDDARFINCSLLSLLQSNSKSDSTFSSGSPEIQTNTMNSVCVFFLFSRKMMLKAS